MQIAIRYILAFLIIFGILAVIFSDGEVKQQLSRITGDVKQQVVDLYPNRSCEEPVSYRLGEIDERFGMSRADVIDALSVAESVWEDASNRDLFVYDQSDENAVMVNFIYDQRQADIVAARASESNLNTEWESFDQLVDQYDLVSTEYESRTATYESDVSDYEALLKEFNATVDEWNDVGGSQQEFKVLKDQEFFIKTVFKGLEAERHNLNDTADRLNALADQINRIQSQLNRKTDLHNEQFHSEEAINSGDFDSYDINIYQYYSIPDLHLTLAHEMGHAIGIDHVEDPNAIMHYLLEIQDVVNLVPHEEDMAALLDVCGV